MDLAATEFRDTLYAIEGELATLPQVQIATEHYFADGLYCRKATIPAGVALTGAVHLREHLCVVQAGHIAVLAEDGNWVEFKAGDIVIGAPGSKRIGYALEDTVWLSVHACAAKTVEDAEEELVRLDHAGTRYNARNIQALIEEKRTCLLEP